MIETLLSLPPLLGCLLGMAATTVVGLVVALGAHRWIFSPQGAVAIEVVASALGTLFRVVGWLFTLLLSLTFADVIGEVTVTENVLEREAATIVDIHQDLNRFGLDETRGIQALLADYTQAVIDHDWPALVEGELSGSAEELLHKVEGALLGLETGNEIEKTLRSRMLADVDLVSDYRLLRLRQANEHPPLVLIIVFLGFLATMVYFGFYRPVPLLIGLMTIYTAFVGAVIYLILALAQPFEGAAAIDRSSLEYALETIRAALGAP
jgi:hypothetical protein